MLLLLTPAVFGQQRAVKLKDAAEFFDIKVVIGKCKAKDCSGPATFSFYKKGGTRAYQVISLPRTIDPGWGETDMNVSDLYDDQNMIYVDDFNFDGMDDVAISDGANGFHGKASYRIYLSSRAAGKFVFNKAFSALSKHFGMFEVDKKKKEIETRDKSGCCYHITERYTVLKNRPVKTYVFEEDALGGDGNVTLTTRTLVKGKWKTTKKVMKTDDYYTDN
jgi:hypothetical protein